MDLFGAVSAEEIRSAQIITGVTMAAFMGAGVIPALRPHARTIRMALAGLYFVTCIVLVGWVLVR
ncbi:MAG: hypothetical protein WDN25_05175 [Acetobacteraceae bacterium]